MATYNLGQAAIVDKGAWSASASYVLLNEVTHNGGSFLCKTAHSAIEPGVNSSWKNYWTEVSRGVNAFTVTFGGDGTATFTVTFSDGTTTSFVGDTSTVEVDSAPTNGSTNPVSSGGTYTALHNIGTDNILDSAVTLAKMAANSVNSSKIVDGSIATVDLADLSVTTAKLANTSVTTAKLADKSVTAPKIGYGSSLPSTGTAGQIFLLKV